MVQLLPPPAPSIRTHTTDADARPLNRSHRQSTSTSTSTPPPQHRQTRCWPFLLLTLLLLAIATAPGHWLRPFAHASPVALLAARPHDPRDAHASPASQLAYVDARGYRWLRSEHPSPAYPDHLDVSADDLHLHRPSLRDEPSLQGASARASSDDLVRSALTDTVLAEDNKNKSSSSTIVHEFDRRRSSPVSGVNVRDAASTPKKTKHDAKFVVFATLIPVLVLLSGIFAGLTLGLMSLDETQLQVLAISGTPKQKEAAKRIMPIRKDGHLLLTTLLVANMIVNETLPIISDPVLGGGVQSVVVSTVLIVIFSEIIPQSVCSRYGLQIGAFMAWPVRILIWALFIICWPISRLLHFVLGPHHGIVYRRAELKELINMHAAVKQHGGDLKRDTVTIVGGALDLQEKVVGDCMTPIKDVFMLPITAKLDYETLAQVVHSGHSRVPVYEQVEVPAHPVAGTVSPTGSLSKGRTGLGFRFPSNASLSSGGATAKGFSELGATMNENAGAGQMVKRKKIIGILLAKQCVLLDPEDATPLADIPINSVPSVPSDEPLLNVLNTFQEGRSHMAIVSRRGPRREVVESITELGSNANLFRVNSNVSTTTVAAASSGGSAQGANVKGHIGARIPDAIDEEKGVGSGSSDNGDEEKKSDKDVKAEKKRRFRIGAFHFGNGGNEQMMPQDATLNKEGVANFMEGLDGAPLGIITLEDVLEELIGEEIYDEYDEHGQHHSIAVSHPVPGVPPSPPPAKDEPLSPDPETPSSASLAPRSRSLVPRRRFGLRRSRSAPGRRKSMDAAGGVTGVDTPPGDSPRPRPATQERSLSRGVLSKDFVVQYRQDSDGAKVSTGADTGIGVTLDTAAGENTVVRELPSRPHTTAGPEAGGPPGRTQSPGHFGSAGGPLPRSGSAGGPGSRPVVVRTTGPGGTSTTTVVSESFLRGRRPGTPGVLRNLDSSMGPSASRPSTPQQLGTPTADGVPTAARNRFKSIPVAGAAIPPSSSSGANAAATGALGQSPLSAAPATMPSSSAASLADDPARRPTTSPESMAHTTMTMTVTATHEIGAEQEQLQEEGEAGEGERRTDD